MDYSASQLLSKKIGVFGRGGCGKSTVVVLLARALLKHGCPVLVLDADSTNVGLHRAFGIDQPPRPLIEYFGGMVFSGGAVTCPVDDPTPLAQAVIKLEQMPSVFYREPYPGLIFLVAGKLPEQGIGAGCDGPISKIARDLTVAGGAHDAVTLVDGKAGFEDSARGVVTGLDLAIVVVDPSSASIEMASSMKRAAEDLRAGSMPAVSHLQDPQLVEMAIGAFTHSHLQDVLFVINNVGNSETEDYIRQALVEKGIEPVAIIPHDGAIAESWLKGDELKVTDLLGDVEPLICSLESTIHSSATG